MQLRGERFKRPKANRQRLLTHGYQTQGQTRCNRVLMRSRGGFKQHRGRDKTRSE